MHTFPKNPVDPEQPFRSVDISRRNRLILIPVLSVYCEFCNIIMFYTQELLTKAVVYIYKMDFKI